GLGVIKSDLKLDVPEIDAPESLRNVKLLGTRVTHLIEPARVVESVCFNHERIRVPVTHGIPPPCRVWVLREFAPVHKDLPVIVPHPVSEQGDFCRRLKDSKWCRKKNVARPQRQTPSVGPVDVIFRGALLEDCPSRRLEDGFIFNVLNHVEPKEVECLS